MTTLQTPTIKYAGFWIRFVAFIIDGIIIHVASALISLPFVLGGNVDTEAKEGIEALFGLVIGISYFIIMTGGKHQSTLGKMAFGLQVMRTDGQSITYGRAFGRYMGYILSYLTICIGFMMAGWTERKQGLHDKICDTVVVYKDKPAADQQPPKASQLPPPDDIVRR